MDAPRNRIQTREKHLQVEAVGFFFFFKREVECTLWFSVPKKSYRSWVTWQSCFMWRETKKTGKEMTLYSCFYHNLQDKAKNECIKRMTSCLWLKVQWYKKCCGIWAIKVFSIWRYWETVSFGLVTLSLQTTYKYFPITFLHRLLNDLLMKPRLIKARKRTTNTTEYKYRIWELHHTGMWKSCHQLAIIMLSSSSLNWSDHSAHQYQREKKKALRPKHTSLYIQCLLTIQKQQKDFEFFLPVQTWTYLYVTVFVM